MKNMKLWDWVLWNQRLKQTTEKVLSILCHQKNIYIFFSCVCINGWY